MSAWLRVACTLALTKLALGRCAVNAALRRGVQCGQCVVTAAHLRRGIAATEKRGGRLQGTDPLPSDDERYHQGTGGLLRHNHARGAGEPRQIR